MATTFGKSLFTGSSGSGFLYPESIGKIDKVQEGVTREERGVYTFHFGDSGNSDGVSYLASGDTILCPLMDYEVTSDMSIFFREKSTNAINKLISNFICIFYIIQNSLSIKYTNYLLIIIL